MWYIQKDLILHLQVLKKNHLTVVQAVQAAQVQVVQVHQRKIVQAVVKLAIVRAICKRAWDKSKKHFCLIL